MESSGRHQVVANAFATKSECLKQMRNPPFHTVRKVGIARIGATNVCSERTARAIRIAVVSKLIVAAILFDYRSKTVKRATDLKDSAEQVR